MALAPEEIGLRISGRRRELGWTHQKLADEMGVELRTAQRWQTGTLPRLATLMRLADVMGVEHSYFIEGTGRSEDQILDRLAALEAAVADLARAEDVQRGFATLAAAIEQRAPRRSSEAPPKRSATR
jgi:transcriptional regulator with XRE-family HTH domain